VPAVLLAIALGLGPTLAPAYAQDISASGPALIASAGETVLLREQPGYDAVVLAPLGDGSAVEIAGEVVTAIDGSSWLPVVAAGQSGYVPAGYVGAAPAPPADDATSQLAAPESPVLETATTDAAAVMPPAGAATTTTEANLRSGPSVDAAVLMVLPPGTPISIDGAAEDGFVPVTGNGVSGWLAAELLSSETAVDPSSANPAPSSEPAAVESPDPAPAASRESTGIVWPFAGGEWQVVQGYNNGTHENRGGFAQYKFALDWARTNGETAGQPVYAPVSGTVQWADRGSGGVLIDAGNGFGVALFHVTLDGRLGRGDAVAQGQALGEISGPGGDGFMSMAHVEIDCWRLTGDGHESVPFAGPNAIAGQEFPDSGGTNQYMGATVTP
jgi:uncharacterized protein YraI